MARVKRVRRRIAVGGENFGWVVQGGYDSMCLKVWAEPPQHGGLRLAVYFDYASKVIGETANGWIQRQTRMISPGVVRRVIDAATAKKLRPGSGGSRWVEMSSDELGIPKGDEPLPPRTRRSPS